MVLLLGDFVKNQIGHSSLRVASNYRHFEYGQKREMVESCCLVHKLRICTQLRITLRHRRLNKL
jgi:hypothetical protein